MAARNNKTNAELATEVPALIEQGLGLFEASRALRVGMPRFKDIATKQQIEELKKNGAKRIEEIKAESEKRIKAALSEAVKLGYGLTKARKHSGAVSEKFYDLATPEQIEAFKRNSRKATGKSTEIPVRQEGIIVITDQSIARAVMQDIIANHPAIGRHHV